MPALADQARTTVLVHGETRHGAGSLPRFRRCGLRPDEWQFPEGPTFSSRINRMIASRNGPVHARIKGGRDVYPERAAHMKALADHFGLTGSPSRCAEQGRSGKGAAGTGQARVCAGAAKLLAAQCRHRRWQAGVPVVHRQAGGTLTSGLNSRPRQPGPDGARYRIAPRLFHAYCVMLE